MNFRKYLYFVVSLAFLGHITYSQVCVSSNFDELDLIETFQENITWPRNEKYSESFSEFLLYHHKSSVTIKASYRECPDSVNCHCAVYMRVQDGSATNFAYIDFCQKNLEPNSEKEYEFKFWDNKELKQLKCNDSGLKTGLFICLKTDDFSYTIATQLVNNNVQVDFSFVEVYDDEDDNVSRHEIAEVRVTPTFASPDEFTEGLCGDYSNSTLTDPDLDSGFELWELENMNFPWDFDISSVENYECYVKNSIDQFIGFRDVKIVRTNETVSEDKHYILFQDADKLRVSTKYRACRDGWQRCSCALFIQASDRDYDHYAFVDACGGASEDLNVDFKYYEPRATKDALNTGEFGSINCSALVYDETNLDEWSQVPTSYKTFKCARLYNTQNSCETYLIEAIMDRSVKVKVNMRCGNEYMNHVSIYAPKTKETKFGGLCGKVNGKPCGFTSNSNQCEKDSTKLTNYWNIESTNARWNIDLSNFIINNKCNFYNYERTFSKFNKMDTLKTKSLHSINSPVILYDHNQEVIVYSQFKPCTKTSKLAYCSCSFYLRVNNNNDPEFVFIDFCDSDFFDPTNQPVYELRHFKTPMDINVTFVNCTPINDETNEKEWENVPVTRGYFKCAKLNSPCIQYMIRTVNTPHNIQVQVDATCGDENNDPQPQIDIYPALKGENVTQGLCGYWYKSTNLTSSRADIDLSQSTSLEDLVKDFNLDAYEKNGLLPRNSNRYQIHSEPPKHNPSTVNNRFCRMVNDPHMTSFMGTPFEFQYEGSYILYITNRIAIVGLFNDCSWGTVNATCLRGLKVYANALNSNQPKKEYNLKTYDKNDSQFKSSFSCEFDMNKQELKINDIHNDLEWYNTRARNTQIDNIDCYKTISNQIEKFWFMIKFDESYKESRMSHTLVQVEVQTGSPWLNGVVIYPSSANYTYDEDSTGNVNGINGGVCGVTQEVRELKSEFWIKQNKQAIGVKFPPCSGYTSCATQEYANAWVFNENMVQDYESWNGRNSQEPSSSSSSSSSNKKKLSQREDKLWAKVSGKTLRNEIVDPIICHQLLDTNQVPLSEELEKFKEKTLEDCLMDIELTNDANWAYVHERSLRNAIIEYIQSDQANFGQDGLIKKEVLDLYGITCPNKCSNQGECFRNPKCQFGQLCDNLVLCACREPFGSSACDVNIKAPIDFDLVEDVFDSRNLSFVDIFGVNVKFSDNNTLYYGIKIADNDRLSVQGVVDTVFDNYFRVTFPFGYIPEIHQHTVNISIAVSYNSSLSNVIWRSMTFYDSKCRTILDDKSLSPDLKPDTCVSSSKGMCSVRIYGKCLEPHPCSGAFDLGLIVQSSIQSAEKEFQTTKNALAEVIGQLRVESNQVHVGMMVLSQIMRTYSSTSVRDQRSKRATVDKLLDIPYIPYMYSNLVEALDRASNEMFNEKFIRDTRVPQVAVLVNDAKSHPRQEISSLATAANKLKQKGISVFAVGIGQDVDESELSAVASSPDHVFLFDSHDSLFARLDELTSSVCSSHIDVPVGRVETERLAEHDVRYYKTDVRQFKNGAVELLVDEVSGRVRMYASTVYKNPTSQTSDFKKRSSSLRSSDEFSSRGQLSGVFFLSEGEDFIYFTIETDKAAEVKILIQEF